jgi:hypothetical protein
MRARVAWLRARLGRKPSLRRATAVTAATLGAAMLGGVVFASAGSGGTTALWTGSVEVAPQTVTAGSIVPTITGSSSLSEAFTRDALVKTGYVTIGNSGTVNASAAVSVSIAGSRSTTLADSIVLTLWPSTNGGADCTDVATPSAGYAVTATWASIPANSQTVPAGSSFTYCIRTRLAASALSTTASLTPVATVTMTIPGTSWSASATAEVTQRVVADPSVASDYTNAVRNDGATHFWRLGEARGSILYDWIGMDDAYAGSGVVRGTPGAVGGDSNTATTFSGDANGTAGTRTLTNSTDSLAVEAWFKTTSTTGGRIVGFSSSSTGLSSNYDRHIYLDPDGHVSFGAWPSYASVVATGGAYNDGQWHQVVGNLGPSGQYLYIDGLLVGSLANTAGYSYPGYWRIGGDSTWSGDPWFDGVIDDVAVYSAPLTASAIAQHFTISGRDASPAAVSDPYGTAVSADTPTLYWRLGENSATTALDSSPNAHPGFYSGSVTTGATGAVQGTRNSAASFGGTSGLVTSSERFTNPQTYSAELWFNTTSTTGGKLIGFGGSQTGTSQDYDRHVYLQNDGKIVFGANPGPVTTITSGESYNNGQWHHVVATESAATGLRLFVDGQIIGTIAAAAAQVYDGYWRVGGDNLAGWPNVPTTAYVTANIDEVAVYGSVLTAAQVKKHYSVGTGTPTAAFTSTMSGQVASVDGSTSNDYDGTIASYSWNWGDGSAAGSGATAAHTYSAPGTYAVTLSVSDNAGKTDSVTGSVVANDITAPSAPTNVVVTDNSDAGVTLSWTASSDNVGVVRYQAYRNEIATKDVSTGTTADDAAKFLTPGATYTYTVKAFDAAGNVSAASASVSVTRPWTVSSTAWYQVKPQSAGTLCVNSPALSDFTIITQDACATSTMQNWQFVAATTSGYVKATLRAQPVSLWNVNGTSMEPGANIILYHSVGAANEEWLITVVNPNVVTFTARHSNLCLTVPGSSGTAGTALSQDVCTAGALNQQFTLVVAP